MEACGACGQETGTIVIKKQGRHPGDRGTPLLPKYLVNPEARCEFCHFLGAYFASEDIDPKENGLKWGAAKMVVEDSTGVRNLLAYVPFNSEDKIRHNLSDGTEFEFRHGTVIGCVKHEDGQAEMVKVLERGT